MPRASQQRRPEAIHRPVIRFRFNPAKAYEAIVWMLTQAGSDGRVDLHTALKACYFADKSHLSEYSRPIFGARYLAMPYGPVPVEIYDILKGEPLWLWEIGIDDVPWRLRERGTIVPTNSMPAPNLGKFSPSDLRHLELGFARARKMTFNQRTRATHGLDWQKANLGWIDYADMIEGPDREAKIADLRDISGRIVL